MTGAAKTLLVMAGGTGGHVFPALAVAQEMRERGYQIHWLGTRRGMEATRIPQENIPLHFLAVTGIRGKRLGALLQAPFLLLLALWQALVAVRRIQPAVVLGMGGFVAGPGGVAAWLLRKPLVIHEQNAIPGTTNKMLAKLATRVLEGFDQAFAGRASFTGNPVRPDIVAVGQQRQALEQHTPLRVLVFGGSQGALAINQVLPEAIAVLGGQACDIRHQAGKGKAQTLREDYQRLGIAAQVDEFIDDMAAAYAWADLAICRAGALTVAELAAAGLPAILVPLPNAIDDHQMANARWLVQRGGALLLPQADLTGASLARTLQQLIQTPQQLTDLAHAAYQNARPDATRTVADICEELANG